MERIDSKWDFQTKGKNNFRLDRLLKQTQKIFIYKMAYLFNTLVPYFLAIMSTEMERIDSKSDFQTKGKNNFRLDRLLKQPQKDFYL